MHCVTSCNGLQCFGMFVIVYLLALMLLCSCLHICNSWKGRLHSSMSDDTWSDGGKSTTVGFGIGGSFASIS